MGNHTVNNGFHVPDMEKYKPKGWGKKQDASEPFEYTLASGDTVLIRRIGMSDILRLGLLDKLDFFSASLFEDDKKKPDVNSDETKKSLTKGLLTNFDKMEDTIDALLVKGVVAPVIESNPTHPSQRVDGVIYVDTIPFDDKVELFGEILETEGLSSFREEPQAGVGHVSDDKTLQDTPL